MDARITEKCITFVLPELKDEQRRVHFEQLRQELNSLPEIDYELVNKAKLEYFESHDFRMFVYEQDERKTGLSLAELYKVYTEGSMQLSLF